MANKCSPYNVRHVSECVHATGLRRECAPIRAPRRAPPPGAGLECEVSPLGRRPALVGGGAGLRSVLRNMNMPQALMRI